MDVQLRAGPAVRGRPVVCAGRAGHSQLLLLLKAGFTDIPTTSLPPHRDEDIVSDLQGSAELIHLNKWRFLLVVGEGEPFSSLL